MEAFAPTCQHRELAPGGFARFFENVELKTDIDKMHAYRDAVRGEEGLRVVRYASILYPGPDVRYSEGLEAIRAYPGAEQDLEKRLRSLLRRALHPTSDAASEVPDPA